MIAGVRFASSRAIFVVLALSVSGCGGGGETGASSGDGNSDDPGNDSGPPPNPPTPPVTVQPSATCPLANAADVPTNTWVRLEFPAALDPATVSDSAVTLTCDGTPVPGRSELSANVLTFMPDATLSANTACQTVLDPLIKDSQGHSVSASALEFATGPIEGRSFSFAPGRNISNSQLAFHKGMVTEADQILISWASGNVLSLAHSDDGGESFVTGSMSLPTGFASFENVHLSLIGGVTHATWRSQFDISDGFEILYTHSVGDPTELLEPALFTTPYDIFSSFSPTISADSSGNVTLTWFDDCIFSLDEYPCWGEEDHLGVYASVSNNGGDTFGMPAMLGDSNRKVPQTIFAGGKRVIVWNEADAIKILEYGTTTEERASIPVAVNRHAFPVQLRKTADDRVLIFWYESGPVGPDAITYRLALYSPSTSALSSVTTLESHSNAVHSCATIASGPSGRVIMAYGFRQSGAQPSLHRELRVSDDSGANFFAPYSINFMLTESILESSITESFCPQIAMSPSGDVYLSWGRQQIAGPYNIYFSKGTPAAPCGEY